MTHQKMCEQFLDQTMTSRQKFKDLEQERLDKQNGSTSNGGLSHAQQLAARDKVRQLFIGDQQTTQVRAWNLVAEQKYEKS